ncbi:DUF1616 domain-containing protein [Methanobacterium formicicum]|jgi:uncharacterized membrane protein|uniref:Membrane protein n=2 Tax=Methanobacterium TaxID=2160 RepID=A0A0S4FQJ2_METFO|nr:DUF1616 domain-containing protein [Methanobacterium formicicum]CEL25331.1 putative membrane protein [Methanobacterium formicicum]
MKGISSKDLMLLLIISIITAIFASTQPIDNFIVNILVFMVIFVSSGYSLMSVLYPEENYSGLLRKPLLLMELCVFLTILISVIIKYSSLGLQLRDLILILSLITIVLSITTYILRINHFKGESEETSEKFIPTYSNGLLSKNLLTLILLSVLMIVTVIVPPINKTPLWMVPGSLFVCFIPGYLLMAVTFPKNDDLELVERFGLGCGASLVLTSLIGLAFNYTAWSIRLELILIVLAVFSLIFCLITFLRTKKIPLERRPHIPKLERILRVFLIICIILTLCTAAYTIIQPGQLPSGDNKTNSSTDFYIKGLNANTLNLTSGTKTNLTMVVVNREGSTVNYRLLIQVNSTILKQDNITLQNNEKMEIPFNFTAGTSGERKMEFLLYKLPDNNPYKTRELWMRIT